MASLFASLKTSSILSDIFLILEVKMKYHYEPIEEEPEFGTIYHCDDEIFDLGTLYLSDNIGLIVVQTKFDPVNKCFKFGPLDAGLANDIFRQKGFREFFLQFAAKPDGAGRYPVVNVRKIMWSLRMKPLRKDSWERELQALL